MPYRTCDHLKEDGVFCQSPALKNQTHCHFHLNARARRLQMAQARRRGEACRIQLPLIEDMHAVQVSLQQVLDALSEDRIDHKRAGLMLYALQQAATNLNSTPDWKGARPAAAFDQPLLAVEAPPIHEQFGLPQNVDLELSPETALEQAEAGLPACTQKKRLDRIPQGIRNLRKRVVDPDSEEAVRRELKDMIKVLDQEEQEATWLTEDGPQKSEEDEEDFIVAERKQDEDYRVPQVCGL
jgi:hypothetical protein